MAHRWKLLVALSMLTVGCTGSIDEPGFQPGPGPDGDAIPGDDDGDGIPDTFTPAPAGLRRLTQRQYLNAIFDTTGIDLGTPELEPDAESNGFIAVGHSRSTISRLGVEQYETTAYDLAARVIADEAARARLVPCAPDSASEGVYDVTGDVACLRTFVESFGRRVWRRPLSAEETDRYVGVATEAATALEGFWPGIEFALAGLVQSPNFLFRVELGSGPAVGGADDGRVYDDWEMASRLSFAVCNSTPDDALLDAAAAGELTTDSGLRAQVDRLVGSDCARAAVRGFFDELFAITRLSELNKDTEVYPQMTTTLGESMREGLLATVERWVVDDGANYREFFTREEAMADGQVAALYGVDDVGADAELVSLPTGRQGLLGQAAFLARYSHAEKSSPTRRGLFVRTGLLCQSIPPPPDDVGELPEPSPDVPTARDRLAEHRENASCAGCHAQMDPIGLALENFDGVGVWRDLENGATIDPSGELDGVAYADGVGLGETLSEHPRLLECMVRNLYRYATGHIETAGEARSIYLLARDFEEEGLVRALLAELLMSEGFRTAGAPQ